MENKKILSMLSLCQRAGKLSSGENTCEKLIKSGDVLVIIIAVDASDNTKEKFKNKALYYELPAYLFGTREELGRAIGKNFRAVLAVCDENFAIKIKEYLSNNKI